MSFATEIENVAGEPIVGIVVGTFGGSSWGDESDEAQYAWGRHKGQIPIPNELKNRVLTWDELRTYLDYAYDSGYGTEECHPLTAWTETKVLFIGCYDGSTWVASVPRNPTDMNPSMIGGG